MKKVLNIILIIFIIIFVKLFFSFSINEIIIWNYNNNIYNTTFVKTLYIFNFNQPYIAYYNEGNILYKTEKYEEAIKKYNKSLEKNPPQNKVCDIRINLSLSMIKLVDSSDYNTAFEQLEEAKNNLYNNNCASSVDDSGYSKDAEKLENEINKLQDQLNNSSNSTQSDSQDEDENQEDEEDYSDIEEELNEIEKKSNSSRNSDMTNYENLDDYSFYSGKRW